MFSWVSMLCVAMTLGPAPQEAEPVKPAETQPVETLTTQPAQAPTSVNPPQAQIYEQLLRDTQRSRQPILSSNPEPGAKTAGTEHDSAGTLLEGVPLVERAGRLIRRGDRSEFTFVAGSLEEGAPPTMEFNKNGLLEAMEGEYESGVTEFVISAEVTRYRGRNYLTLIKYRRKIDHGNLRP